MYKSCMYFESKQVLTSQSHYGIMSVQNHIIDVTNKKVIHKTKPYLIKVSALLHPSAMTTKWAWHVEMMGLIGAGNNPMVGMTVAVAVAVEEAMNK